MSHFLSYRRYVYTTENVTSACDCAEIGVNGAEVESDGRLKVPLCALTVLKTLCKCTPSLVSLNTRRALRTQVSKRKQNQDID